MSKGKKSKAKARKKLAKKAKTVCVHFKIRDAEDLYQAARAVGLRDEGGESRKMTNGEMTVNVVKWGQTRSFDEWYVTDIQKDGKTLVIIDEARKCTSTYKDMDKEGIRLLSVPSLPPVNGGWEWVS